MRRKTGLSLGAIATREPDHRAMNRYEIRVAGHLDQRRVRALGCEELRLLPGGTSVLVLRAADQAALHGLLTRLRDAGLELVAAERVLAPAESMRRCADPSEVSKEDSDAADR